MISFEPLFSAALYKIFTDFCLIQHYISWVPWVMLMGVLLGFIFTSATYLQKWNQFKIITASVFSQSILLITHILRLPLLFFVLRQKSDILFILSKSHDLIERFIKNLSSCFVSLILAIFSFFMLLKINANLAFLTGCMSLISLLIFFLFSRSSFSQEKSYIAESSRFYGHVLSSFRYFETIKASGLERMMFNKWYYLFCKKNLKQDYLTAFKISIININRLLDLAAFLLMIYWGGIKVFEGCISAGQLIAYYMICLIFNKELNSFFLSLRECQSAYISSDRVNDIKTYKKENRFLTNHNGFFPQKDCSDISDEIIACHQVFFFYNRRHEVTLKSITLHIKTGEHIALVGRTGSGKSTLAKLLAGLYQPTEGDIFLKNKKMTSLSSEDFSRNIAYVSQEISLFSGSIYDNLTLESRPDTQLLNTAIFTACLREFISERGLYGKVEENGCNFSGGERQRMEIARAIIQNTPILVLDEATSALDVETEARLIYNLKKLNKTIVFVAHRLSTVRHCSQIIVLEEGAIIEKGSHDELLNNKKNYYDLVQNKHKFV